MIINNLFDLPNSSCQFIGDDGALKCRLVFILVLCALDRVVLVLVIFSLLLDSFMIQVRQWLNQKIFVEVSTVGFINLLYLLFIFHAGAEYFDQKSNQSVFENIADKNDNPETNVDEAMVLVEESRVEEVHETQIVFLRLLDKIIECGTIFGW
jgi:hypothetical protein